MLLKVYIATLTLLICHQIDAAYWKEWEMYIEDDFRIDR